jgi:hypothetical protein
MTAFAIALNEAEPSLLAELPPTDARFRPDQRCLEIGELPGWGCLAGAAWLLECCRAAALVRNTVVVSA